MMSFLVEEQNIYTPAKSPTTTNLRRIVLGRCMKLQLRLLRTLYRALSGKLTSSVGNRASAVASLVNESDGKVEKWTASSDDETR
ncbi:6505_t:CDS:2 [Acaulospora colombiana]|uniref:6505_t:CDS:1 n=1 Tax=Acaulospora colombiana TaxID=27376 RepID=A0ACA9N1M9_9GLOM|nr:6505_t:CDS:2 [Acaulospora colombiana]